MDKDKSGAAFGHGSENGHCCGLTKREWFAGQALPAILTSNLNNLMSLADAEERKLTLGDLVAKRSVQMADALLRELEKNG